MQVLALLLALHGCVGGQTGESPSEPRPDRVAADAGCRPDDCPPPTPDELDAFSRLVGRTAARDVPPDGGLDELVFISDIVLLGELTGVGEGRKVYLGPASPCDVDAGPEAPSECVENPRLPQYSSRVNLLIQPISIFRGELERDAELAVEFPWPNNASLERVIAAAPRGARLLLLANRIRDAEELARPLEEAGIAAGSISSNLFRVREFGLGFENSDGLVDDAAFNGAAFIRLVTEAAPPDSAPLSFQKAIEAVMTSASKP
jgi:hypothetical protein